MRGSAWQVRGVHSTQDTILVWSATHMSVFQLSADVTTTTKTGSWPCETEAGVVYDNAILALEGDLVQVGRRERGLRADRG